MNKSKHKYLYYICILLPLIILYACDQNKIISDIHLSSNNLAMEIGETIQLELIITPISATIYNTPKWKSSDNNIVKVDNVGNITAVSPGECTITVSCGNIKEYCKILVKTLEYNVASNKVYAYIDKKTTTSQTFSLRLLENSLTLDTNTNEITGNGLMLNLKLFSSPENSLIDTGTYYCSASKNPLSFYPGEIIEDNSFYYTDGTYMEVYSNDGLHTTFIKDGTIKISRKEDIWNIKAMLYGEKGENIQTSFYDNITWLRNPIIDNESIKYTYSTFEIEYVSKTKDEKRNILKLRLNCGDTYIEQYVITPISCEGNIPQGKYSTKNSEDNFTIILHDDNSHLNPIISENGIISNIIWGELITNGKTFSIRYKDTSNRIITCHSLDIIH